MADFNLKRLGVALTWRFADLKRPRDHYRLGPNNDVRCSAATMKMHRTKVYFGDSVTAHFHTAAPLAIAVIQRF
jgi:hypothetical protein